MNTGLWWNGTHAYFIQACKSVTYLQPMNLKLIRALSALLDAGKKHGFYFNVSAERQSSMFVSSTCLAFCTVFLVYYVFLWIGNGILFLPQLIVIINSFLIRLCCLHVRPYLPFYILSPINIFQISDRICRIQMKLSQQLLVVCCLILGLIAFS